MKLDNRNPISTADILITIEGVGGYFSEFSGVKYSVDRPVYSDGLSNTKRRAASGSIAYDNVTLSKAFDPEEDGPVIEWAEKAKYSIDTFDITLRPVKRADGVENRGNKAWQLSGCRLAEFSTIENMNTGDGNAVAMLKIVLTVESAVWA